MGTHQLGGVCAEPLIWNLDQGLFQLFLVWLRFIDSIDIAQLLID